MFSTKVIRSDQTVADRKEKIGYSLQKPFTLVFGTRTIEKLSETQFQNNTKVKQIHLLFRIILAPFAIIFSPILLPIAFIGIHLTNRSSTYKKAMESWNTFLHAHLNKIDLPPVSVKDFKEKRITEEKLLKQSYIKPQELANHDLGKFPKAKLDINFGFKRFFGKTLVIHLPGKMGKSRLKSFNTNMEKIGLKSGEDYKPFAGYDAAKVPQSYVDRFDSTSKTEANRRAGAMACFLAQLKVLKHVNEKFESAKKELHEAFAAIKDPKTPTEEQVRKVREAQAKIRKYSVTCVLEDNAAWGRLVNNRKDVSFEGEGHRWRKMLEGLPSDWDAINLLPGTINGKVKDYKKVNPYILKCNGATGTKGVIFNHTAYPKIIKKLEGILKDPNAVTEHVDQVYRKMQRNNELNVYAPHKTFIFREDTASSVGCSYNGRVQFDCV